MATQIKTKLDTAYGDSDASFATVKIWEPEFKHGRASLADDELSGRSKTATVTDIIEKVHQIVLEYLPIMLEEIAQAMGILKEGVCRI